MAYRGFITRAQAGLRAPRSRSRNISPGLGGVISHWGGPAVGIKSHDDCYATWRRWQRYHMDTKGWVDIAYTCAVCDHGYIFAGRGAGVRTAANGTNDANYRFYAIVWIGGQGETPTKDALDAFWAARKMLRESGGAGSEVKKHSDFRSTSCSGSFGAAIAGGATEPSTPAPAPSPTPTPSTDPEDDEMLKKGDSGDGVKAYQRRLMQWADQSGRTKGKTANSRGDLWEKFLHYGADGDFGSTTEGVVKEFQKAYDLDVTGRIGGVTAGILAMFAVNSGGGGSHDHPFAAKSHDHDSRYVLKSAYDSHTHDEGRTGGPR